jgi:hypothetical protein
MGLLVLAGQALATFAASFITGYLPLAFKAISGKSASCAASHMLAEFLVYRQTPQHHQRIRNGAFGRCCVDYHYTRVSIDTTEVEVAGLTLARSRGVSTLFSSLPENNNLDGIAAPTHVIGIALLAGFALMMLWVFSGS